MAEHSNNNVHSIEEHVKIIAKVLHRMKLSVQEKRAWEVVIQAACQDKKADTSVTYQGKIETLYSNLKLDLDPTIN